jgi:hypothetical protein
MSPKSSTTINSISRISPGESPASYLVQEYKRWQTLFDSQPTMVQRFLETQARGLADALIQPVTQVRFIFPDRVVTDSSSNTEASVPPNQREQMVGGIIDRLTRSGIHAALRQRLDELEVSQVPGVAICAGLLRFATAAALVNNLLPSGRTVKYKAAEGEETPTLPSMEKKVIGSAITAAADAIAENGNGSHEESRGELIVPYVPYARRFFLPQWIAFDDSDQLLVNAVSEAEAHIASMQRFVRILHAAVALAPYMVTDEAYQQKRYGMLGQLINQGRALARYQTREIITTIKRRAAAHDLNRGLSLSLPYFDDQALEMREHAFDVIPAGRIMFLPGFVVLAVGKELAKVEQDTRLDRSTRKHLMGELHMLAAGFASSSQNNQ